MRIDSPSRPRPPSAGPSVFQLRRFKNTDPPHLAEIWKSQPPQRGLMQPVSPALLELCVYSKQYFDPAGLIVATDHDRPVGFAHAGFGPDDAGGRLDTQMGVTQLVMQHASVNDPSLSDLLLSESEQYLRSRGAQVLYGGGIHPINPFYLGLYGGSELPGVLDSDPAQRDLFLRNGYGESGRVVVMQRELARFRTLMSRTQRQIRREMSVEYDYKPGADNWFEACHACGIDQLVFSLVRRRDQEVLGRVQFWEVEPLATSWGIRTAGLWNLHIDEPYRRSGLASHLLSEAFKEVQKRGMQMVEVHTMQDNQPAIALYEKLGFTRVDSGAVLRREA